MNRTDKTMSERLVDAEKTNTTHREEYQKLMQAIVSRKLSFLERLGFAALAIVGLMAAFPFAELSLSKIGSGMGFIVRIVTIPGLVLALTWAVVTGWIAARGLFNLRTLPPRIAGIGIALGFFGVVLFLFVYIVPVTLNDPTDVRSTWSGVWGIQLSLIAFFFLIIVGLCVVLRLLYRIQFQTREKLLEIEYRIAELAEKVEGKPV
jgi:Na+/proline symporter